MSDLNIYQRINKIRQKIDYIKKDATVQGYQAVTHDLVTAMVRTHLIEHGVIIEAPLARCGENFESFAQTSVEGLTNSGKSKIRYEAVFDVSFVNIDNPDDRITIPTPAHADDSGDKAPGKAVSYATKIAILKLFAIETGVNDESRMEEGRKQTRLIEHAKAEVDEYLENGDSLAVFLLGQSLGQEAWTDVYNAAPDGQKTKFKKAISEAEKEGAQVLKAINQAILTHDAMSAKENIEDLTEGGKRLLANKLGHEKAKALGDMLKELDG